jgi:stress protein
MNLEKGSEFKMNLEKGKLEKIVMGLGWDVNNTSDEDYDLDSIAVIEYNEGDYEVIYFNHKYGRKNSIWLDKDDRTGASSKSGDDEKISVDLESIVKEYPNVSGIDFYINIYNHKSRGQSFQEVQNAYARIVNVHGNEELARYTLERAPKKTDSSVKIGRLSYKNSEWIFKAIGEFAALEVEDIKKYYKDKKEGKIDSDGEAEKPRKKFLGIF